MNAVALRRLSRSGVAGTAPPRVSIVIPARDEERDIGAAVRSHLAQDYPDFEVVVVEDRSRDGTAAILAGLEAEDPRLSVVPGAEPPDGWLGKPHALAQGARRASGSLLLFADADVRYGLSALSRAVATMEERRLDLLAFFPRLEMEGFWENVLMPYLPMAYYFGPSFLFNSDLQRRFAAGGGAGMLMRRDVYAASGGHAALRDSVIDDVHLAARVRRAGGRCRMVLADRDVSLRMYRGLREICDGFTKNVAFALPGWAAALLTLGVFAAWTLPAAVLAAAVFGAAILPEDVRLAAAAFGIATLARASLAVMLRYPIWPTLAQPLTAAVWAAITLRSLAWRFGRRRLVWRGRQYDARRVRF